MATRVALNSMSDITAPINIKTDANEANSLAPANTLFSEREMPMSCSSGASSLMIAGKMASTAPSFATRPRTDTDQATLSDRLTPLLISAGLVKGTTHSSVRKQSGAAIRASALWPLDGGGAEGLKADF
jgi:hypothetical protein